MNNKNKLYKNDYVIFDTKNKEYEFIKYNYPYVYYKSEIIKQFKDIIFISTKKLPKEIQEKLLNMINKKEQK